MLKDCPKFVKNHSREIIDEYKCIDDMDNTYEITISSAHQCKNRYRNIQPYDHNLLSFVKSVEYINASPIKGYNGRLQFIAAQGPLEESKI